MFQLTPFYSITVIISLFRIQATLFKAYFVFYFHLKMKKSLNLLVKNKNFNSNNLGRCLFSTNFTTSPKIQKVNKDNIYENVLKVEYAVRGPIAVRAGELENELKKANLRTLTNRMVFAKTLSRSFGRQALQMDNILNLSLRSPKEKYKEKNLGPLAYLVLELVT